MPLLAESLTYDLVVYSLGSVATLNQGLSLVPEAQTYAGVLLAPIDYSKFDTPPGALSLVTMIPPAIGASDVPSPVSVVSGAVIPLDGGRDGVAVLTQDDFIGGSPGGPVDVTGEPAPRGLAALACACDVAMLAAPDILIRPVEPPVFIRQPVSVDPCPLCPRAPVRAIPVVPIVPEELPPLFPDSAILAVQAAMLAQCEALGDRVALLDPPWDAASDASVGVAPIQAWRDNFDSEYGGLYFPWLAAPDPLRLAPTRALPPSGHVAGLFASTDIAIGVHKAPANAALAWAQDVTVPVDLSTHGVLNTLGVNVIRSDMGRPMRVMGARTVSSDPTFRFINVRRLICMIRAALQRSMRWVVFEPNTPQTRSTVSSGIGHFLQQLYTQGALVGPTAAAAFAVICDDTNNTPMTQSAGQLIAHIALAPSTPFEFVLLRLGLSDDSLDIQERGVVIAGSG
ncbi:phage tail sheath family protein [Paraburkholderia sp. MM5477-R1]|uniref:phage tail sheath family protein n=1 Tax=Paraburkholderia sp. MM5477-R1 TaxID=2991062 RepID=UPI003D1F89EA